MNRSALDFLMRRNRDERNPYGSKGGYVVRTKRGRDNDYAERSGQSDYRVYPEYSNTRNVRDYERYGQSSRDYEMEDGDYHPIEEIGTFNSYYGGRDGHYRLSNKDIKKWEKGLENADGTRGKKWEVDQVRQIAQQQGIRFEEYSPELFTAVMNMHYSLYCKVLGGDANMYAKLTKAWLEDDNFEGEPEEKAMLHYKMIVAKDED